MGKWKLCKMVTKTNKIAYEQALNMTGELNYLLIKKGMLVGSSFTSSIRTRKQIRSVL